MKENNNVKDERSEFTKSLGFTEQVLEKKAEKMDKDINVLNDDL